MLCPYCGASLEGAAFCPGCGKPRPVYAAPEGFVVDGERGLWLREETLAPVGGVAVTVVTLFDPVAGTYTQQRHEQAVTQLEPEPEPAPEPEPEPAPEPPVKHPTQAQPSTAALLPEGFVADRASGLAYRVDSVLPTPGGPVVSLTWYDPARQTYAQARHRPAAAPARPGPSRPQAAAPTIAPAPAARGKWGWVAVAVALCLLVGAGAWAVKTGRLPFGSPSGDDPTGSTSAIQAEASRTEGTRAGDTGTSGSTTASGAAATTQSASGWTTTAPTEATEPESDGVPMADATMEEAVRQLLRVKEGSPVTDEHLAQVTFMVLRRDTIYLESAQRDYSLEGQVISLADLARMTGLRILHLSDFDLQPDLEMISTLTQLEQLHIYNDGLNDIAPLKNLKNLRTLDISDNQVTDLSPLESLTELAVLYIDNNPITDLSPLGKMARLDVLNASDISATDWSPVMGLAQVVGMPEADAEEVDRARAGGSYVYTRGELWIKEMGIDYDLADTLWIYSDGLFDMDVNLGSSLGHVTGHWKRDGDVFTLAIDTWNFEADVPTETYFVIDTLELGGIIVLDGPAIGPLESGAMLFLTEIY